MKRVWIIAVLLPLAVLGWLLGTPNGSWALCRSALRGVFHPVGLSIRRAEGSLLGGLRVQYLQMDGVSRLPEGSDLRIRLLSIRMRPWNFFRPELAVQSARLHLPESEPILFSGRMNNGRWEGNVYSRRLDSREVLSCFMKPEDAKKFRGPVGPLEVDFRGTPRRMEISGSFQIEELNYYRFALREAAGLFQLTLRPGSRKEGMMGDVTLSRGTLMLKYSSVLLRPSRLLYAGDPKRPVFDLTGSAVIETIPMEIQLKGTFRQPDLRLSSDPPLSQEQLLLMLATGKRWKTMEGSAVQGTLPLDLATDFLDYAVFGGEGSRIMQRLGLGGSLKVSEDGKTAGVGLTKSLSDKVGLSYGVEQTQGEIGTQPTVRQKVGAELEITKTDTISVEAENEVTPAIPSVASPAPADTPDRNSKVLLKYKKKF